MADLLHARGPLHDMPPERGIRMLVDIDRGKIDLRGDPDDREFQGAIGRTLDLILPAEPMASAANSEVAALWLGPDHWLVTCKLADVAMYIGAMRRGLGSIPASIVDVSDGRSLFHIDGPDTLDVLAKGCPLDLDPSIFRQGQVAGTRFGKAAILLHRIGVFGFDIYVGRSYARYLLTWLDDAGMEHGVVLERGV